MQFSISRILLVTAFISFVLAASFGLPTGIGFSILTVLSICVLPSFILIGVVHSRGLRQSFFLGVMVTGIPHFMMSAYISVILIYDILENGTIESQILGDGFEWTLLHPIGYLVGVLGGFSGMAAYAILKRGSKTDSPDPRDPELDIDSQASSLFAPEIYPESEMNEPAKPGATRSPR